MHALLALLLIAGAAASAAAQTPAPAPAAGAQTTQPMFCGQPVPPPAKLPPAGSPPLIYQIGPCFGKQGGTSVIEPQTYLYYIQLRPSLPSQDRWVPYDETAEKTILDDFKRLWATSFLDDLSIEVTDYPFANGVVGKLVAYHMEERERVKFVDYEGSKKLELTKIDEKLKEKNAMVRVDSFIDPGLVRRVEGVLREMLSEKGHQFATVRHEIKPVGGGPKLVHLTFFIEEGPTVKIRDIDFIGNTAIGDGRLKRKMKETKEQWFLSFITGRGTYQEAKFEEDADKVLEYYREKGYITAQVGQPEMKSLGDSADKKTRWIQLRVPVKEGNRYRVGQFKFEGNTVVKSEALRPLFKLKTGQYYSEKHIRKGLEKARELYGSGGYFEFTGFPDLKPLDLVEAENPSPAPPGGQGQGEGGAGGAPNGGAPAGKAPIVDVTMRMQEGKQYLVNRVTFVGNTTTRDNVIRREVRLFEGGVFNTEALKFSIRRLNQLGYFKNLENDAIQVDKTPNADNKVDVTLKFEEQNRNQLTFGAGVSQFEGFFGQLSFQTSNFLGRGETFTVSVQAGSRAHNYQLAFTEPYLFDRAITAGFDIFKRDIRYISQFTQKSAGGNLVFGFPLANFTRMFMGYSYEQVKVSEINEAYCDPALLARNPFLRDSLLLGAASCLGISGGQRRELDPFTGLEFTTSTISSAGTRTISRVSPSFVHNTVDNPIFPNTGRRVTLAVDLAGLGGNTAFYKPRAEGVFFFQHTRRTSLGFRAGIDYISPYGDTKELPIFEKLFLGGEYSVRGFDIRSIGPRDDATGLVIGGNKSLVVNAEYLISIAGPVRLVLFYDAGQVRDRGQSFSWKEPVMQQIQTIPWVPAGDGSTLLNPTTSPFSAIKIGETSAFKTSMGAEVRFFMPVLNVPFRLIFAHNPQRLGVLDNNFQQTKSFTFRFAVGSTF